MKEKLELIPCENAKDWYNKMKVNNMTGIQSAGRAIYYVNHLGDVMNMGSIWVKKDLVVEWLNDLEDGYRSFYLIKRTCE